MTKSKGIVMGTAVAAALSLTASARDVCPGDTDRDRLVGLDDLLCVLQYYGCTETEGELNATWRTADCDRNGCIDLRDLIMVIDCWGPCDLGTSTVAAD